MAPGGFRSSAACADEYGPRRLGEDEGRMSETDRTQGVSLWLTIEQVEAVRKACAQSLTIDEDDEVLGAAYMKIAAVVTDAKTPLPPSCSRCKALMTWDDDDGNPMCPFCDGGAGD